MIQRDQLLLVPSYVFSSLLWDTALILLHSFETQMR